MVLSSMIDIKEGRNGNVIVTITDSRGNVIFHETVKADEADVIIERTLERIV